MRIVAITQVKNEIDIIEAFVRHTLAVADQLLVLDHQSTDGTLEALHELKASGLPLSIFENKTILQQQWEGLSKLAHEAAASYGADWVLPVDADEFVLAERGVTLGEALQDVAAGELPAQLYWRTYVPDPTDDRDELNPVLRLRHRLVRESKPWAKVIIPGSLALRDGFRLAPGSHAAINGNQACEALPLKGLHLAHFPVRSAGQYASKVIIAYLRYRATADLESGQGFHYDYPFHLLRNSFRTFAKSFYQLARNYAVPSTEKFDAELILDPFPYLGAPLVFTARYDEQQAAISNALSFAEKLASEHALRSPTNPNAE